MIRASIHVCEIELTKDVGSELGNIEYCRARSRVCPQHHERLAKETLVPGDAVAFVMGKSA